MQVMAGRSSSPQNPLGLDGNECHMSLPAKAHLAAAHDPARMPPVLSPHPLGPGFSLSCVPLALLSFESPNGPPSPGPILPSPSPDGPSPADPLLSELPHRPSMFLLGLCSSSHLSPIPYSSCRPHITNSHSPGLTDQVAAFLVSQSPPPMDIPAPASPTIVEVSPAQSISHRSHQSRGRCLPSSSPQSASVTGKRKQPLSLPIPASKRQHFTIPPIGSSTDVPIDSNDSGFMGSGAARSLDSSIASSSFTNLFHLVGEEWFGLKKLEKLFLKRVVSANPLPDQFLSALPLENSDGKKPASSSKVPFLSCPVHLLIGVLLRHGWEVASLHPPPYENIVLEL